MTYKLPLPRLLEKDVYPPLLQNIEIKPDKIWITGNELWDKEDVKFLCVVGSRNHSLYAVDVVRQLCKGLRGYPIIIVSGLAIGIDTLAHKAAMDNNLKTIAVPGSGLNSSVLYPRQNFNLAALLIKENRGTLLSPFPPHMKARPFSFPLRNQLMASMSHAVLIIECRKDSGTMITARLALEMNRDLLVVPGSIIGKEREGSNSLSRTGAYPVLSSDDILECLGFAKKDEKAHEKEIIKNLSREERIILKILEVPANRSTIIDHAREIPFQHVPIAPSTLEAKGLIQETMGIFRKI